MKMEQERGLLIERLKEVDQLKSLFIATMSHELRMPLNSIIGFSGILLQGLAGKLNEEQINQISIIRKSGAHLLELINDVIDISKIEADQVELSIERFDLSEILQEVEESFRVAIDEKGLNLHIEIPEKVFVESDRRRTKQIVMNLVSNAVKFTDNGNIHVKAAIKDKVVEISVKDTGIGIKKEDMDLLFKQFSRIHTTDRLAVEGTGLGLYLSRKILNLLGGQIMVKSIYGVGSTFILTLPLKYEKVEN